MIPFYKPPILTVIFRMLGILFLIVSAVAAIITLRQGAAPDESPGSGPHGWQALGTVAVGVLVLLFYWGIAQAIDFLGKTAFYTEQLYVQASTRGGLSRKPSRTPVPSDSYDADDADDEEDEEDDAEEKEGPAKPKADVPPASATPPGAGRTKFACKACGQRISALDSEIGNRIACPNCGEDVTVS